LEPIVDVDVDEVDDVVDVVDVVELVDVDVEAVFLLD
ncbi:unnamed protein product, partial [Adineta steineri]